MRVVVVGGGISGLAAAHALREAPDPPDVVVLEAAASVGGALRLGSLDGVPVDVGADGLVGRTTAATDLAREVGLESDLCSARVGGLGVVHEGSVVCWPGGTVAGVPGDLRALASSGLLTRRGLARAGLDAALPVRAATADVEVAQWVTARLGREVTDLLVEPWLAHIYGRGGERLSLAATAPALAAARARGERAAPAARRARPAAEDAVAIGVAGGVGRLPTAVAAAPGVTVRTAVTVRAVTRAADGGWRVEAGPVPSPQVVAADGVVVAVPAPSAGRMLRDAVPAASRLLDVVDYVPAVVVLLGYERRQVAAGSLTGAGLLVPAVEGRAVVSVSYPTRTWAWVEAAAPDLEVVRVVFGGVGQAQTLQREDADLVALAADELSDLLGLAARPAAATVTRWGGAVPRYTVGHPTRAAKVHEALAAQPGLAMCGAALDGVSVAACAASGRRAAAAVLRTARPGATMSG